MAAAFGRRITLAAEQFSALPYHLLNKDLISMSERLVYVVDDDDAVRRSLSLLLRAAGYQVQEHNSAETFLEALEATPPVTGSCAVIDVRMAGMDGLSLQQRLVQRPGVPIAVVIVTGHADVPLAVQAMRNGAVDFIEKPYPPGRMLTAVADAQATARAAAGGRRRSDRAAEDAATRLAVLTAREREVLDALVGGKSNKVIARELGLSPRTVEAHRAALMDRLSVRSLAEAIRLALAARMAN
jgi:two-component system response regulator FixJ